MAIPAELLNQLLALDEEERLEVALVLLDSIDEDRVTSEHDRAKLHATIDRALAECDRGETIPFTEVINSLRAKRATRLRPGAAR